ncbi:MAG: hypothetical protein ACYTG5_15645 [Planctomycetota bacterium]|jgi:hypothetical protein
MSSEELGAIGQTHFDHRGGSAWSGSFLHDPEADSEASPGAVDEVQLSRPEELALQLLRLRVLEHSRRALRLDHPQITFAAGALSPMESFVGRLISDQNLLAARRCSHWPTGRIQAALEEGMTSGLEETLQILLELDELDADSWGKISAALGEFQRKIESALPPG